MRCSPRRRSWWCRRVVVGLRHLRESAAEAAQPIDWLGTSLLSAALFLAVLVLVRGNEWGWTSLPVLAGAALVVVLLVGFWVIEHRVAEPLIAPPLLRNPVFVGTTLVALAFAAAGFAPITYLTLYLLTAVGAGPIQAGLLVAPFAVATSSSRLRRTGSWPGWAHARRWPGACSWAPRGWC